MTIKLTLPGAIRTAKNSPMLVGGRAVVLPSPAYREWCAEQLKSKAEIKAELGAAIPLKVPVSVKAAIFRDKSVGDWSGYTQAVGDVIQSAAYQCQNPSKNGKGWICRKRTVIDIQPLRCPHCDWPSPKPARRGLGIIEDDKLIRDWDGTRLLVDKANPRVELQITVVGEAQAGLFTGDQA